MLDCEHDFPLLAIYSPPIDAVDFLHVGINKLHPHGYR